MLLCASRQSWLMHGPTEAILKPVTKTVDQVFGMLHRPGAGRQDSRGKESGDLSHLLIASAAQSCGCTGGLTFDKKASKLPFFRLLA